jgi:hypothetical protein
MEPVILFRPPSGGKSAKTDGMPRTKQRERISNSMSDIVERLKSRAAPLTRARELSPTAALCRDAAVEIERLRAELAAPASPSSADTEGQAK